MLHVIHMIKLFSGTANPELTQEVAKLLNLPISKAEVIRFGNSEAKVTIQEDVRGGTAIVIQSTCNPTDVNLMELAFFADALKRSEAQKIIAVVPYFGYSRQNEQHRPGECVSMHVVVKLLEQVGYDEIITFELHEAASAGVFSVPFNNVSMNSLLVDAIKKYTKNELKVETTAFVAPDYEATERTRKFGEAFFPGVECEVAVTEKKRNLDAIHETKVENLYGDVNNKTVIIVDDVATSGGTLIHSAEMCLAKGATKVFAAITHADFNVGIPEKLQNSPIERIFAGNTIPLKEDKLFPKLEVISIAPTLAEELKKYLS